jgi:uncharacterized protein YkwD
MKRKICIISAITLLAVFLVPQSAIIAGGINVTINGEAVAFPDQPPASVDGRTLVPIRAVFEHMGFEVGWYGPTRTVTLERNRDYIAISIGDPVFTANGQVRALDVPAQIIGSSTMLPIRALVESVGYNVGWDGATSTVIIYYADNETAETPPQAAAPEPTPVPAQIQQIRIPNRRITEDETAVWLANYYAMGGAHEFELEVIRLTNIERANAGLSPVEAYDTLMYAARFKSQGMVDLGYFAHESPVYGRFDAIAREVFGMPQRAMGENLARGQRTPYQVIAGWMGSEGHRNNLLNAAYTRIGVGFYNNTWTQKLSS